MGLTVGWIMTDLLHGFGRRLIFGLGRRPGCGCVHGPSDATDSGPCMGLYLSLDLWICGTSRALLFWAYGPCIVGLAMDNAADLFLG